MRGRRWCGRDRWSGRLGGLCGFASGCGSRVRLRGGSGEDVRQRWTGQTRKQLVSTAYPIASNDLPGSNLQANHIAGIHQPEMFPDRIHPDAIGILRVTDADVTGDALGVSHARPIAEHGGHVQEDMFTVFLLGGEGRDTRQRVGTHAEFMELALQCRWFVRLGTRCRRLRSMGDEVPGGLDGGRLRSKNGTYHRFEHSI